EATLRLNGVPNTIPVTNMTFNQPITLNIGENTIYLNATDSNGNIGTSSIITVTVDLNGAVVEITNPIDASNVTNPNQTLEGTVDDSSINTGTLSINGIESTIPIINGVFNYPIVIQSGTNTIRLTITDSAGNNSYNEITTTLNSLLPQITITSPINNSNVNTLNQTVTGTVNDPAVGTVEIFINNTSIGTTPVIEGQFTTEVILDPGSNEIKATGTNAEGTGTSPIINVNTDIVNPNVIILSPSNGETTGNQVIIVTGVISDQDSDIHLATIYTNDIPKTIAVTNMAFTSAVTLNTGDNLIYVSATDSAGNTGLSQTITITYDISLSVITITSPVANQTYTDPNQTLIGTISDNTITEVTHTFNGISTIIPVVSNMFLESIVLREGLNIINISATNDQSEIFTKEINVFLNTGTVGGGGGGGIPVNVEITYPANEATVNTDSIDVNGTVDDTTVTNGVITLNGVDQYLEVNDGLFSKEIFISPGTNTITVSATNYTNNTGIDSITVDLNKTALPSSAYNSVAIDDDFIYAGNSGGQIKIYNKTDYTLFDVLNVCLGDQINSIAVDNPSIYISCSNNRLVYKYSKIYNSSGFIISYPIAPPRLMSWDSISWIPLTQSSGNITLTVDILNEFGTPIQTDITNSGIIDLNNTSIRLQANLESSDSFETAELFDWSINYTIENELFDVSSQTLEILKPGELCIADLGIPNSGDTIKVTSAEIATEKVVK
ncbi:MAG: hypothetical protein KAS30_04765, partial [Candidatus Diapherotrites archaeon]|nr:hypothetical protein [Candidatus Diapherotrites archaeon]